KAFDTVSHQHIIMGLKQKGVDIHISNLVVNMYENIYTEIGIGDAKSDPIQIKVGVKQGDLMSPFLFNLAMDPLLCNLEQFGKGYQYGTKSITAMAFADDLVLLSGSWDGMRENIAILEDFCNLTGLKTQGEK
ncbi:PO21 protein, partial [Mionectes macconnelli]|nr:PO21 protein [Mionectes macconnelli]